MAEAAAPATAIQPAIMELYAPIPMVASAMGLTWTRPAAKMFINCIHNSKEKEGWERQVKHRAVRGQSMDLQSASRSDLTSRSDLIL